MRLFSLFPSLMFLALIVVSCTPETDQDPVPQAHLPGPAEEEDENEDPTEGEDELGDAPEVVKYLALGDSYTIGEGVPDSGDWPNQLTAALETLLPESQIEPARIIATTGWTTSNLNAGMDAEQIDTSSFDLVSLLIGVNNQYQGLSLEAYEVEFEALLQRAVDLAGGQTNRVFVVSIPDYGYTPFGQPNQASISSELALFNASCSTLTANAGIAHYNITPISQQWPQSENWVAPDGLHPSGAQYSAWVNSFADAVEMQLRD